MYLEYQFSDHFVEFVSLFGPFFFVFHFDDPFNTTIWSFFWVVKVGISELLAGCEKLPILVKSEDVLGTGVVLAETGRNVMLHSDFFFEFFFFIKCLKQLIIDLKKVILGTGIEARVTCVAEKWLELSLGKVVFIPLIHMVRVLSFQNLIPMVVVPGPRLRIT